MNIKKMSMHKMFINLFPVVNNIFGKDLGLSYIKEAFYFYLKNNNL